MKGVYFVSGIDTDIGKTVATRRIGKTIVAAGQKRDYAKARANRLPKHRRRHRRPPQNHGHTHAGGRQTRADHARNLQLSRFASPCRPTGRQDFGLGQNPQRHARIGGAIRNCVG